MYVRREKEENYCVGGSISYELPQSRFKRRRFRLTRRTKDIGSATTIRAHVIANVDLFTSLNGFAGGNIKALHTAAMVGRVEIIAISTDGVKAKKKKSGCGKGLFTKD